MQPPQQSARMTGPVHRVQAQIHDQPGQRHLRPHGPMLGPDARPVGTPGAQAEQQDHGELDQQIADQKVQQVDPGVAVVVAIPVRLIRGHALQHGDGRDPGQNDQRECRPIGDAGTCKNDQQSPCAAGDRGIGAVADEQGHVEPPRDGSVCGAHYEAS